MRPTKPRHPDADITPPPAPRLERGILPDPAEQRRIADRPTAGFIATSDPVVILDGPPAGFVREATLLTLFSPNTAAVGFIIRLVVAAVGATESLNELVIRRFDDSIPASEPWALGLLGGRLRLYGPDQRYEIVLDSDPTKPIEYAVDFWDQPSRALTGV